MQAGLFVVLVVAGIGLADALFNLEVNVTVAFYDFYDGLKQGVALLLLRCGYAFPD